MGHKTLVRNLTARRGRTAMPPTLHERSTRAHASLAGLSAAGAFGVDAC